MAGSSDSVDRDWKVMEDEEKMKNMSPPFKVNAKFAYEAEDDGDQITFAVGDVLVVTENKGEDWWAGYVEGKEPRKEAFFPLSYVGLIAGAVKKRKKKPRSRKSAKVKAKAKAKARARRSRARTRATRRRRNRTKNSKR